MVKTYTEQLQGIVNQYMDSGEEWPATRREIAAWAVRNLLWAPQQSDLIGQCAEQLARAMREDFIIDPQGRTVRAKHAARVHRGGQQLVLWADIRNASLDHMEVALQQRRQQIVGDCHRLKQDVDSYNQNYNSSDPIQLNFNFTNDLNEIEAADDLAA